MKRLVAAVLALALATPAAAKKVGGRELPDTVQAGTQQLGLNGAGIRKRFIIKVYAAGLYLKEPAKDAAAILSSDVPWAVRMVFLRDVSRAQIMGAYREGFEKNSPGPGLPALVAKLDQIAPAIPEELKEGQEMSLVYVPGEGTTVLATGTQKATVPGKEFADALLLNWLGGKPADEDLKKGLLGG